MIAYRARFFLQNESFSSDSAFYNSFSHLIQIYLNFSVQRYRMNHTNSDSSRAKRRKEKKSAEKYKNELEIQKRAEE